jgi:hypothetical protein
MGEKPHKKVSKHGRRALANYVDLGRTAIQSHMRMFLDNQPLGALARPDPAEESVRTMEISKRKYRNDRSGTQINLDMDIPIHRKSTERVPTPETSARVRERDLLLPTVARTCQYQGVWRARKGFEGTVQKRSSGKRSCDLGAFSSVFFKERPGFGSSKGIILPMLRSCEFAVFSSTGRQTFPLFQERIFLVNYYK